MHVQNKHILTLCGVLSILFLKHYLVRKVFLISYIGKFHNCLDALVKLSS